MKVAHLFIHSQPHYLCDVVRVQEYDATCLIGQYIGPAPEMLIDQV